MRLSSLRLALPCALALALPVGAQEPPAQPPPGDAPEAPPAEAPARKIPADKDPQKTASGLGYSILEAGAADGAHPKMGDKVSCHYTGWLENGTVFDSSQERGEPISFLVGQVIPGWNEGLALMTPGARWKLVIPGALAYGERGVPGVIPPGATLIFEVQLISITPVPEFKSMNPEKTQTTASGLKYEVIDAGRGEPPAPGDAVDLTFAFWTAAGKLLDSTVQSDAHFFGTSKQMFVGDPKSPGPPQAPPPSPVDLKLLSEVPQVLREGARVRFEVPPALLFGDQARGPDLPANSTTHWEFTLVKLTRVPAFALSAADKLKTTASGLQYEVLREGTGKSPSMGKNVTVHYAGWLTDGTPFDSSYGRGQPATFRLGEVIAGWNEGLQLMKAGGVCKLTIPAALAYGADGRPGIPPNATLVFVVELLETE